MNKGDLSNFGKLLHESWLVKKCLSSSISNSRIDEIYNDVMKKGALGGKLLGAGGGGFFLFYCPKEFQSKLRKVLKKLKEVPFRFENYGSKIINMDKR